MDEEFIDFLANYNIRDGSIMKESYAKKIISYLNRAYNEDGIHLNDEYQKANFLSLIEYMEEKTQNGQKNKNTFLGDVTALHKYAEYKKK